MEIVYSSEPVDAKGRRCFNPRYFDRPKPGVTKVTIHGNWPRVAQSYREVGAEVEVIIKTPPLYAPPPVALMETAEIPDNWRDLHWQSIRKLASSFSAEPVLNKDQAVEVVEAELARREGGEE